MPSLPLADTEASFDLVRRDEGALGPGVAALVAHLGLGHLAPERFADGSLPVYALGDAHVLKLYPPVYLHEREIESSVLTVLDAKLSIPTPRVQAVGSHDGWGYVLMDRLRGESLATAWPRIDRSSRVRLVHALGVALRELHAHGASSSLAALPPGDWAAFMRAQREGCVARQRACGLGEAWIEQIPGFIEATPLPSDPPRVLLHTEVMREHLRVEEQGGEWRLTGTFDFEPAMRGAAEYELASIGVFVTCDEPGLLRALLTGYGYASSEIDRGLSRRALAYALLHRFSNLKWYLSRVPAPAVGTLDALADAWWSVEPE